MTPIEGVIGYRFRRKELLREALTHTSFAFERGEKRNNERLEFLGDSVLSAVVARFLYDAYPDEDEGRLSKRRASLVSRSSLASWAGKIRLGEALLLGAGEESTGGRSRPSVLADALEALIGAIYLDGGFEAADSFVHLFFLGAAEGFVETDFKSRLQEIVQKKHQSIPEYKVLQAIGPDHDKVFSVRVSFGSKILGEGTGKTKKDAEQEAARIALAGFDSDRLGAH